MWGICIYTYNHTMIFDFVSVGEKPWLYNRTRVDARFIPCIIAPVDIALINRPPGTSLPMRDADYLRKVACYIHSHSPTSVSLYALLQSDLPGPQILFIPLSFSLAQKLWSWPLVTPDHQVEKFMKIFAAKVLGEQLGEELREQNLKNIGRFKDGVIVFFVLDF